MKSDESLKRIQNMGLRVTVPRRQILNEIARLKGHFSAEDVLLSLRARGKRASRVTIYRLLPSLLEVGILREVIYSEGHAHYERVEAKPHHEHLICESCGRVVEFQCPDIEDSLNGVCAEHGFAPRAHIVEITGLCRDCARSLPDAEGRMAMASSGELQSTGDMQ
jgi:Fur family transcriptional regulator, ferric uptake regulator